MVTFENDPVEKGQLSVLIKRGRADLKRYFFLLEKDLSWCIPKTHFAGQISGSMYDPSWYMGESG